MPDLLTTLKYSGATGLLALLSGTLLMILAAWLVANSRRRATFVAMLLLASIPAALGLAGTYFGYQAMDAAIAASAIPVTPAEYAAGEQQAWSSTQVGLYSSAPALLLAWVGLLLSWRSAQAEEAESSAEPEVSSSVGAR